MNTIVLSLRYFENFYENAEELHVISNEIITTVSEFFVIKKFKTKHEILKIQKSILDFVLYLYCNVWYNYNQFTYWYDC